MTPRTAELLREPFLQAVEHIDPRTCGLPSAKIYHEVRREPSSWFATSPTDEWITKLIHPRRRGGQAPDSQWKSGAICTHWTMRGKRNGGIPGSGVIGKNACRGFPFELDDAAEIEFMLDWLTQLPAVYSEAVDLAVQMRPVELQRGTVIYRIVQSRPGYPAPRSRGETADTFGQSRPSTLVLAPSEGNLRRAIAVQPGKRNRSQPQGNRRQDRIAVNCVPTVYVPLLSSVKDALFTWSGFR